MSLYIHNHGTAFPVGGGMNQSEKDRIAALEQRVAQLEHGMATSENYGLSKISELESVTETDSGLVLGAKEKNAVIPGTLANILTRKISETSESISYKADSAKLIGVVETEGGLDDFNGFNGLVKLEQPGNYARVLCLSGEGCTTQIKMMAFAKWLGIRYCTASGEWSGWKQIV